MKTKERRFPILLKLLLTVGPAVILSVFLASGIAVFLFRNDSIRRIQENNLNLTQSLGQKVDSDLFALMYETRSLLANQSGEADFSTTYFATRPDVAFIARISDPTCKIFQASSLNARYLASKGLEKPVLLNIIESRATEIMAAQSGALIVRNFSQSFPAPVLMISFPLSENGTEVVLILLDPGQILSAFQISGATEAFLLNPGGEMLAHSDPARVLAAENLQRLPIVESFLTSPLDNGYMSFKDSAGTNKMGSFKRLEFAALGVFAVEEEARTFDALWTLIKKNLILALLIADVTGILIFLLSRRLTQPIWNLLHATGEIARGNFRLDLKAETTDEIGRLTDSFAKMAKGLSERELIKEAFGKFVHKEIANRVLKGQIELGGERKNCAILFSDVRGFTTMSESRKPEEVLEMLNEYFTLMVACVSKTGGVVDKFIGDGLMAHWGALEAFPNKTERAVEAALMMRQALKEYNDRPTTKSGREKPKLQIGIGINTGPVISGQIGSAERLEFTVIGDIVNSAARVESATKEAGVDILISQDAYLQVGQIYKTHAMEPVTLKGKSDEHILCAVLGRRDDPDAPQTIDELRKQIGVTK